MISGKGMTSSRRLHGNLRKQVHSDTNNNEVDSKLGGSNGPLSPSTSRDCAVEGCRALFVNKAGVRVVHSVVVVRGGSEIKHRNAQFICDENDEALR